jgi:hypothetical protein
MYRWTRGKPFRRSITGFYFLPEIDADVGVYFSQVRVVLAGMGDVPSSSGGYTVGLPLDDFMEPAVAIYGSKEA